LKGEQNLALNSLLISQLHQRQSFDDISFFDVFFDHLGGV
jgi:hypothetical protein